MAMAPVASTLWQRVLRFHPDDPIRPIESAEGSRLGHASMLVYSLLHFAGVKAAEPDYERLGELSVTLDDIKRLRELDSTCPKPVHLGYREHHGTLGQGVATSVGMGKAVSRRRQT